MSSWKIPKGTVFIINAQGMEGSQRKKKDGVTYFGCKKRELKTGTGGFYKNKEIINDFVLPSKDKNVARKYRGRHF